MSSLYSRKLYIGITISKSFALSINALLIFDIHDLNGTLFLKTIFLFLLLSLLSLLQQYLHGYIAKSVLDIEVLNLYFC